jgi:hypothetical protein
MKMLPCDKRQKVVKRSQDLTVLRCVNRKCEAFGSEVTEEVCAHCPVRVFKHVRPCEQAGQVRPIPPSVEKISDEEFEAMIQDSPLGPMEPDPDDPDVPDYPKMSLQLWLYKEAVMKWNKAGRPVRTDAEVEEIHKTHCEPCAWYDKEKKRCKGCGCRVSVSSTAVFNKIKMGTEHCPRELW